MLTFDNFSGINNVALPESLGANDLVEATNVDIDRQGKLRRRAGYAQLEETCHKNLWQAAGFLLATCDGDLTAIAPNGDRTVIYPSLGVSRVRYCNLPDGRTSFSNGLINGLTDGATMTTWGVPIPAGLGGASDISGDLFPGDYRYALTHVRQADGLESGPLYSAPVTLADGGLFLSGLPVLAGHLIAVYLSSRDGEQFYLAGTTANGMFSYTGENSAMVAPLWTDVDSPAPVGTFSAFWAGRVLVAVGSVLYASKPNRWEAFEIKRDFKRFASDITAVVPLKDGIYVGTEEALYFLAGPTWDQLQFTPILSGRVVPGSAVEAPGELIRTGNGAGNGPAMLCIADGDVVAGFSQGAVIRLTDGRYRTEATEVSATFRVTDGIPQYLAIPQ